MYIAPSMLSADFNNLAQSIRMVEEAGLTTYTLILWMGILYPTFPLGLCSIKACALNLS